MWYCLQQHFCNSVLCDIVYKKKYSENFGSRISTWARSNLVKIVYSRKNILRILGQELSHEGKVFFLSWKLPKNCHMRAKYFFSWKLPNRALQKIFFLLLTILKKAIGLLHITPFRLNFKYKMFSRIFWQISFVYLSMFFHYFCLKNS